MKLLAQLLSKLLMVAGALDFFFGDRALWNIWHWRFVPAELAGIGGGVLLMALGGALQHQFRQAAPPDTDH
jgi:hypothetical protein